MGHFGVKNGPFLDPFLDPFLTGIGRFEANFEGFWARTCQKGGPKWGQKWVKNGSKMGHFWTPFLTPFGRSRLRIPAEPHMFWAILARTCQKGGQKRGQKWVIFGSKMAHFWTPFWTPSEQVQADLKPILRGFGPEPVKKGVQNGVKNGSKRGQK